MLFSTLVFLIASSLTVVAQDLAVSAQAPSASDLTALWILASITNNGLAPLFISPVGNFLSNVPSNDLIIDPSNPYENGQIPHFVGVNPKFVSDATQLEEMDALVHLAPGDTKSVNISVAERYKFEQKGTYTVSIPPHFQILKSDGHTFETVTAKSKSATFDLTSTSRKRRRSVQLIERVKFNKCSESQREVISNAASKAQIGSQLALKTLRDNGMDSTYHTWFGSSNEARYEIVKEHYENMNGLFEKVTYDCSCQTSFTYSYTHPHDPTHIYLCSAFFAASTQCGMNSQQGALIHGAALMTAVGSGHDFVSGEKDSRDLAISNPNKAIYNADSYEYYEESVFESGCNTR